MMARNHFSALNLESDSEPEFNPEPLSRGLLGGERLDQNNKPLNPKPEHQKQNHQPTILVLKKEPKTKTKQQQKQKMKWPPKNE